MSIRELQERCGKAAEAKGFHDDRPKPSWVGSKDRLRDWQGNKLMLIVSEVAEAQDELRKGIAADKTYYPSHKPGCALADHNVYGMPGDAPACTCAPKPEGVPSEMADVVIRVLDFCYTEGIDLEPIIEEKLAYNATRERLHGKKF